MGWRIRSLYNLPNKTTKEMITKRYFYVSIIGFKADNTMDTIVFDFVWDKKLHPTMLEIKELVRHFDLTNTQILSIHEFTEQDYYQFISQK